MRGDHLCDQAVSLVFFCLCIFKKGVFLALLAGGCRELVRGRGWLVDLTLGSMIPHTHSTRLFFAFFIVLHASVGQMFVSVSPYYLYTFDLQKVHIVEEEWKIPYLVCFNMA